METPQNESPPKQPVLGCLVGILTFILSFIAMVMLLRFTLFETIPPRESPLRAICQCRLKGNGTALKLYTECEIERVQEDEESESIPRFPPSLDVLVQEGFASNKNFTCPSSEHKAPWRSKLTSDYVYCFCSQPMTHAKYPNSPLAALPVLFEIPINHNQNISGIAFSNWDVKRIDDMDEFRLHIQAMNNLLLQERGH